jgi:hypothetical protein
MCLDEALLQGIGAAHQFEDAAFPVDKPPDGFLKFLKTGLGGHLKAHGYQYRKMLDEELAKIKVSLWRWLTFSLTCWCVHLNLCRGAADTVCCAVFLATTAAEGAAGTCVCADRFSAGGSPDRLRQLHRPRALPRVLWSRKVRKDGILLDGTATGSD